MPQDQSVPAWTTFAERETTAPEIPSIARADPAGDPIRADVAAAEPDTDEDDRVFAAEVYDRAEAVAAKLEQLRDRLALQAHLASLDTKTALASLEPELSRLAARLRSQARDLAHPRFDDDEAIRTRAWDAVVDVADRWSAVRDPLGSVRARIEVAAAGAAADAAEGVDTARLQAHLAKLDAVGALRDRSARARDWARQERHRGEARVRQVLETLEQGLRELQPGQRR